jgi:hypothetical protein
MQTSYGYPSSKTFAGDIVSEDKRVKSYNSLENLSIGSIAGFVGTEILGIQNPSPNKFTFSGDLVASNVINGKVTIKTVVNGAEVSTTYTISPVTYATSHAASMTLLKNAYETAATAAGLALTLDTADANGRTFKAVATDNAVVTFSNIVVTAGAGQATVTYYFDGTLMGFVTTKALEQDPTTGTYYVKPQNMCGIMTQGIMTVTSVDAVDMSSTIYAQFIDNSTTKRGMVRTSTDSGKAVVLTGAKPQDKVTAGALCDIELNLP